MNTNLTKMTFAATLAAMSMARRRPDDNCCRVYAGQNFWGTDQDYCLEEGRQAAFGIDVWRNNGSVKCGKNVDAQICPGGFEVEQSVDGQRLLGYRCMSRSVRYEHGTKVGAGEDIGYVQVQNEDSSIILSLHPWVAKGAAYESLDREDKADILWNKITEDSTTQPAVPRSEFFKVDTDAMYDEFGDEFDCRLKSIHSQGNVGKAEWRNLGGHGYTGIFQGADTGFVRLSTAAPVIRPEDRDSDE